MSIKSKIQNVLKEYSDAINLKGIKLDDNNFCYLKFDNVYLTLKLQGDIIPVLWAYANAFKLTG